jgi:hypothetical protein
MGEEETTEQTVGWETTFDTYHKQRDLEPGKPFHGTVEGVYRVASETVHIEIELKDAKWVVPISCPEGDPEIPPEALFDWPESDEYTDLFVFVQDVLLPRNERFSTLPETELKVSFGEDFERVQIDGVDHWFDIHQQDGPVDGDKVGHSDDAVVELIDEYFVENDRGIEVTLHFNPLLERDDVFQVEAPINTYLSPKWEFDVSNVIPDEEQDSTYRLVEAAGGDPEFLEGTHVHVIHYSEESLGLDEHQIIGVDTTGTWALLLPEDYETWLQNWRGVYSSETELETEVDLPSEFREYEDAIRLFYEITVWALGIYTLFLLILFNYVISPSTFGILRIVMLMGWAFFLALTVVGYSAERILTPDEESEENED